MNITNEQFFLETAPKLEQLNSARDPLIQNILEYSQKIKASSKKEKVYKETGKNLKFNQAFMKLLDARNKANKEEEEQKKTIEKLIAAYKDEEVQFVLENLKGTVIREKLFNQLSHPELAEFEEQLLNEFRGFTDSDEVPC